MMEFLGKYLLSWKSVRNKESKSYEKQKFLSWISYPQNYSKYHKLVILLLRKSFQFGNFH